MSRSSRLVVAAALAAGLVMAAGGVASAKGSRPQPVGASGTATCSVQAVLAFSPPLQASATGSSAVSLHAQLVRCAASGMHHRTTGHVSVAVGSIPSNTCTLPATTPAFSGLGIRWTPPSQVKPSSVSGAAGTVTTLANGDAQVAYSALTVTGSFATTSGTITVSSKDTVADLHAACSGTGLDAIALGGSATL